jgi:uncharacterized protein YjbI with pentapeptide repeats
MKTIKPQRIGALLRAFDSGGGASYLAVSELVFFAFAPEAPLLPEVELWKLAAAELPRGVVDVGMPKQRGEVLVVGSAFPPGGAGTVAAPRVAIGGVDKTLHVVGDRRWRDGAATAPLPFTEMPITYERAFGGPGYALNPTGKGASPARAGEEEIHPLPNIEDPRNLVRSPEDRPPPAGLGPYELTWPQRLSKAGTYDAAWQKRRFPGFPVDMDWGLWNAAPEDQRIDGYFRGDEAFTLEHMHPGSARIDGRLPGVQTRAFINQKTAAGEVFREIATCLDTVLLFPGAERGIIIFRGMIDVAEDDAADVLHLVLACEALGEPKPVDHYRDVLARRLDRKKGHLAVLRESDLLPEGKALASNDAAERALFAVEGLLQKRTRRRMERERAEARARMIALGVDPAALDLPPLPPEEPPPDAGDPVSVEQAMMDAEHEKEQAEAEKAQAERHFRETCAARGLDPEKTLEDARARAGGPPAFSADAELDRMRDLSRRARAEGMAAPTIDAAIADPAFEARLRSVERQSREAYRRFAHHYPAAARPSAERAAALREEVAEGCRAGRSFAGCDLTGADLSGLDLGKADFRLAFLERASLAGADLRGADLTDAVLARADLARARLSGAFLAGANLGEAKLGHADADGADLSGAVLVRADLSGATFRGARMARADLSEAVFAGADLTRAEAPEATFLKADLSGGKLAGADLGSSNFIEATVAGVDFAGAKLAGAVFFATNGDRAVFRDADLENLRVVQGSSFEGADFHGARLGTANLRGTKLAGCDFGGAILDGADLSECDLRGATFLRAVAKRARFVRADLTGAIMRSVNLMEGSLAKATLLGTDLRRSNLFRVDMAKARTDEATSLEGAMVKRVRTAPMRR